MNILLIAGGWSPERDVSLRGAEQIEAALRRLGHQVRRFDPEGGLHGLFDAAQGQDFALLNLHGSPGEDGVVQALLETIPLPYQGAGPRGSLLALDKAAAKAVFVRAGLATPAWELVPANRAASWRPRLPYPLVLKPNRGGSSVGVAFVTNEAELITQLARPEVRGQDLIAEACIHGVELTCGVLEGKTLPPILIRPKAGSFFDYASKYLPGASDEICPAPVDAATTRKLQEMAQTAHEALGLADYSRSDFLMDGEGTLWILETNTLPGMTATSLLPQEAQAVGLSFEDLLAELIRLGMRKQS
ncbi:MAG: D-alanine-D-alanine ligase [Desulfomicrobiaceae bacterium]|jgi:D-alanine-D-alanine ligase|nr:D-alanine-D-alanine ligase [Desulfomicrobiaceae bacterium]